MSRFYGCVSEVRASGSQWDVGFMRRSQELHEVIPSAVSCTELEGPVRMEVLAGLLEAGALLLEGMLQNFTDVVDRLWWRRPQSTWGPPPNTSIKLTVRSAASRAIALAAVGRPAAYA